MSPDRSSAVRRWRAHLLWWAGIGLAILIWYWAALDQPDYALPSPESTWHAFLGLVDDGVLGWTLWLTLSRAVIGLGLSCLIGIPTGWALGTWTWLRELLDSWMQVLMAVPPIVLVVVGMIWLGPTAGVVILVVTLVTLPLLVADPQDHSARGGTTGTVCPDGRRRSVRESHGHGRVPEHSDGTRG